MSQLGERLCRCARPQAERHTQRRMITLATRREFNACLAALQRAGIRPIKRIPGSRMLCLHVKKSTDWQRITAHPAVTYAEADRKVSAHICSRKADRSRWGAGRLTGRTLRTCGGRRNAADSRKAHSAQAAAWNIARVQAPLRWPQTRGRGIRLAVTATGIGPQPSLRVAGGINTRGGSSCRDDNGHGTHVAGIAAARGKTLTGVAPE